LPTHALSEVLSSYHPLSAKLKELRYASVLSVNLAYDSSVLPHQGFGYLVPSDAGSQVLGCIWDSSVFPQQNTSRYATRLTVMLGGMHHPEVDRFTDSEAVTAAKRALQEQCGIHVEPAIININRSHQAIPQYEVGYSRWKDEVIEMGRQVSPYLTLSGNAFSGISINDCVGQAYRVAIFRGDSVIRKYGFLDLFLLKPEKHKKVTLRSLPFLCFLFE